MGGGSAPLSREQRRDVGAQFGIMGRVRARPLLFLFCDFNLKSQKGLSLYTCKHINPLLFSDDCLFLKMLSRHSQLFCEVKQDNSPNSEEK